MPNSGVFFVTDELQKVLDNLPADEPRSRLEPFRVFILRWRREGRSYERIRRILRDECKLRVSAEAVRKFVQRRSRPRKVQAGPELEQPTVTPAAQERNQRVTLPPGNDQYTEARERMRRHKEAPSVRPKPQQRFEYTDQDSIDPIVLLPKTEKEK